METDARSDEQVLQSVLNDPEEFGVLIERYEPKLRRYVRRLMPGVGEDMDDVLQNIFLKVYQNMHGFDPSLSFNSWVYRIAHNEAVSWLRKKKARVEQVALGEEECETFVEALNEARDTREATLTADAVARILALLDERHRHVLVLRFLEGKTYEEMGDILAVPQGTVATLLHRAKKAFSSMYHTHHA